MTLQPNTHLIQVVSKTNGHITYATLFNVVFFDLEEEPAETATKAKNGNK